MTPFVCHRLQGLPALLAAGVLSLAGLSLPGWASSVAPAKPADVHIGQGDFTYFGFRVYQATLKAFAPFDAGQWDRQALHLTLTYQRSLKGEAIAERSLQEMQRSQAVDAAQASRWLQAMQRCFPDVQAGDRLQGIYQPGAGIRFDYNGQTRCEVPDAQFARQFMGIWLHASTSAPELRMQLLGLQSSQGS